ncbi:MAG: glycoside hydrolase family 38 C-terminal domain-containing protein [Planctomycetaceae bacterium]|nr:hypothetical protein [Planctomycetaceae bacterium]
MKSTHLICNAHLDPVWLWQWQEGAAEAISTFRTAADFCEQFDGFVFNHNEAILYRWVEEYEPQLFARIQRLVKQGRWHIMGGWHLQPDCNMPSGESFVRQILAGREYFASRFGAAPTTAINFDPFGHTRGLVQILAKCGFDSYIFCRPDKNDCPLPGDDFTWVGYDGSTLTGHRAWGHYLAARGQAAKKVRDYIAARPDKDIGLLLWGVGNHGGGPSRVDIEQINALAAELAPAGICHSTPEAYFAELKSAGAALPRHEGDLNAWAPGCYTSQVLVKQKHRRLENALFAAEKMLSHASLAGLIEYPAEDLNQATEDLLTAEFHDILPGSSIEPVEQAALRLMDHGLEILSRLEARAFFALCRGQDAAPQGQIPILAYNPHPWPVKGVFECEFQLADQDWTGQFTQPTVHQDGHPLPCQVEKEDSNLSLDWRKRVAFYAELQPLQVNRFDCTLEVLPGGKPKPELIEKDGAFTFRSERLEVVINAGTGLMDRYRVDGVDYLAGGAMAPLVMKDTDDPWIVTGKQSFADIAGRFELMSPEAGTAFSGVRGKTLPSVRVIEDGPVRTVIEAVLSYGHSFICQRYKLPKVGAEIEVETRVLWNEKTAMLKLALPTTLGQSRYAGQVAYGTAELVAQTFQPVLTQPGKAVPRKEVVAQKWTAAVCAASGRAVSVINEGIYGSDFCDGEIRLSLLRSPAYSAHPIADRPLTPDDRFTPRIDQGQRLFRIWINAGEVAARMATVDSEALARNEQPFVLSFFPAGGGEKPAPLATIDDPSVLMTAFKKARSGDDYIIRLFEPTGQARNTTLRLPGMGVAQDVSLTPFEIQTLRLNVNSKSLAVTGLMELVEKVQA